MPPTAIGVGTGLSRSGYRPPIVLSLRGSAGVGSAPPGWAMTQAASASSVQTGTSTLIEIASTADCWRFGRALDAWNVRYVHEYSRANLVPRWRDLTHASWTLFGGALRTPLQPDPFGTALAYRIQAPSGVNGLGETSRSTCAGISTVSAWLRAVGSAATPNLNVDRSPSARIASTVVAQTTWGRLDFTSTGAGGETTALLPVDGRDWSAIGGVAAGARDAVVDVCQREVGAHPTSAIPTTTGAATRAGALLRALQGAWDAAITGGRIGIEIPGIRPMGARTELDGTPYFWHTFDSFSCFFDPATGTCTIRTPDLQTNTVTLPAWSRYDLLDLFFEVGNGATVVKYRINGGATVSLSVTGSALGPVTGNRDLYFLNSNAAGQVACWAPEQVLFHRGTRPAWAA